MIQLANIRWKGNAVRYAAECSLVLSQGEALTPEDSLRVFQANLPDDVLLAIRDNRTRTFENWQEAAKALKEVVETREGTLDDARQCRIMIQQMRERRRTYHDEKQRNEKGQLPQYDVTRVTMLVSNARTGDIRHDSARRVMRPYSAREKYARSVEA